MAGTISQICCRSAVVLLKAHPRALTQERHHGLAVRHMVFGKLVSEIFQCELEPGRKLRCVGEGLRKIRKQLLHFLRRLQMPLGITRQQASSSCQVAMIANGGEYIAQFTFTWSGITDPVGCEQRKLK